MPRKSNKRSKKKKMKMTQRTMKQKPIIMIGCSNKHSSLGKKGCLKSEPNCYLKHSMKKQKGGSGCGSCGCPLSPLSWDKMNNFVGTPILGIGQNGGMGTGTCTQCMQTGGGHFFKPPPPIPGPILGSPWNTSVKGLPGENGIGGDRNYLASYANSITNDPQQQMSMSASGYKTLNSMVGGRHKRHNKRHTKTIKRGGGFIPTDLLNLGRNVNYSINSAYNTFKGYNPPVNHLPYKDQLTGALNKGII